jgi:hypothetical protein
MKLLNSSRLRLIFWIALASTQVSCSGILADLGLDDESATPIASDEDYDAEDSFTRSPAAAVANDEDSFERGSARTKMGKVQEAIEASDVIPGMTRSQVIQSWGEPMVREFAGKEDSGHERWTYGTRRSQRGETFLFFENGRVVGWQR